MRKIVPKDVDYLVMLKPQFEAYPDQLVNGCGQKMSECVERLLRGLKGG